MDVDRCGWMRMDVDGCGRMWTDADGCGWMWMDVGGCGWMWMDVVNHDLQHGAVRIPKKMPTPFSSFRLDSAGGTLDHLAVEFSNFLKKKLLGEQLLGPRSDSA